MNSSQFNRVLLLLVTFIFFCSAASCPNPLFYEFIKASKPLLSTMDVQQVVQNNLPKEKLNDFTDSNNYAYSISSTVFKYDGTKRSVNDQISKVSVVGDNFQVLINFNVKIKGNIKTNTYNGTVKIDYVTVDFTKQISQETKNIVFTKLQTTLSANTFKIDISGPSSKQVTNIAKGISENNPKTIYGQLNSIFSRMADTMRENVKKQTLGKTYPSGEYQYIFQDQKNSILYDMSTQYLGFGSTKDYLINGLKGQIPNQPSVQCPDKLQQPSGQNHTFITKQFIKNLENHAKTNFRQFSDLRINSTWVKHVAFQFKLVDLQYIVPEALLKYSQYFLSEVAFYCNVANFEDINLSGDSKTPNTQNFTWSCLGKLLAEQRDPITLLNFTLKAQYNFKIVLEGRYFGVLIQEMQIGDMEFDIVDDMPVVAPEDVKAYITDMKRYFLTWVLGSHFMVRDGPNVMKITEAGIWIAAGTNSEIVEKKNLISMQ